MKEKVHLFSMSILGFLFTASLISLSFGDKPTRAAKLTNAIDKILISKSTRPEYAPSHFKLEEFLSIGKQGQNHIFESIRNIEIDDSGNIYVLDAKACKVFVFDKSGKKVSEFGRKGQGPGEFQLPVIMKVHNNKEIVVNDLLNSRIEYFSISGDLLREIPRAKYFRMSRIEINSKGNIIGLDSSRNLGVESYDIIFFNPDLTPIWRIAALSMPTSNKDTVAPLRPSVFFHLTKDDELVWSSSDKYELNVIDSKGMEIKKIIKEYEPIKIDENLRKQIINNWAEGREIPLNLKFDIPPFYPPLQHFIIDDKHRIFVHTYEKNSEGKDLVDVFGLDGKYLARIALDNFPWFIKYNQFYIVAEDADFPVLKIFKIINSF